MSNEKAPERTIDKLHRETGIPMWALEIAFDLSTRGMLDEETMAGVRVIPDTARVIAESVRADLLTTARREEREAAWRGAGNIVNLHTCELGAPCVPEIIAALEAVATTEKGERK